MPQKSPPLFLVESESTELQTDTEQECQPFFVDLDTLKPDQLDHLIQVGLLLNRDCNRDVCLLYDKHTNYLSQPLFSTKLKPSFVSLDASRPWMIYWCLHGLDLLKKDKLLDLCGIVRTLRACFTSTNNGGGFGGGPGQMPHLATTYAAVLSLCIVATCCCKDSESCKQQLAYDFLKEIRPQLAAWFPTLLQESTGAVRMHHDGEVDVRASYCMIVCIQLLKLNTTTATIHSMSNFILSCQTFEGGFGGEPFCEAHGGYTYCSVAALQLLNRLHDCDIPALLSWLTHRQMKYEGGFQGRTNKLVDGCYSFWQGAALAIVSRNMKNESDIGEDPWLPSESPSTTTSTNDNHTTTTPLLFDEAMLQRYILLCAQDVKGGLRDKPSKPRDFYHSCYNLSGLSISQHYGCVSYGHFSQSLVAKTHPCYNIRVERVQTILAYDFDKE